jgi:hypothetical protein
MGKIKYIRANAHQYSVRKWLFCLKVKIPVKFTNRIDIILRDWK